MAHTQPLEEWSRSNLDLVREAVHDQGWMRHLPPMAAVLLMSMPIFDQPPTDVDLAAGIGTPDNPERSWDGPAWDVPTRMSAEELAKMREDFPDFGGGSDPETVYQQDMADLHEQQARIDTYAASVGIGPVRTCRDALELLVAAGLLHRVVEDGAIRFRPAWPLPLVEDTFPLSDAERDEEDKIRWDLRFEPVAQDIIRLFDPDGKAHANLTTSLERLAKQIDHDVETTRQGALTLIEQRDFSANEDVARITSHKVFQIIVDWEAFFKSRIGISS